MCISVRETVRPEGLRTRLTKELSGGEIALLEEALNQLSSWGRLSTGNLEKLQAIREILYLTEGKEASIDETLTHVLKFYHKFVPFD